MALQTRAFYAGREYGVARDAVLALDRVLTVDMRQRLPRILQTSLERYLKRVATIVATRNSRPYPGGKSPSSLSRRSGSAVASIHDSVRATPSQRVEGVRGYIGGNFYLRTHEFGAVIRATRSEYLTIPLPAALDSNGVPLRRSARMWANTFVARSRRGNLLIFQNRPGGAIVPLYVLKREVRIPPRLGMGLTLDQYAIKFIDDVLLQVRAEFGA
jgi:hypothetical protein